MIERASELAVLTGLLSRHPVVGIIGARQVGKTTLARQFAAGRRGPTSFFDLENPADLARLADPLLALERLRGLVVLDEVQRLPGLFPVLRVLVDRPGRPARFLVLGSASPGLLRQSSESLAGRIAYHELGGLALDEVGKGRADVLWLRGGFPRSLLARTNAASLEWRQEFIRTFLERDVPQLGFSIPAVTLRRFWVMLSHYHGQVWNASEFGRSFGVSDATVRRYLDLLSAALVVRQVQPWYESVAKRQVRAPKVYLADTGLLHALLGLGSRDALEGHPKVGASWEWFVIRELSRRLGARTEECWFWATHAGAELDLLVVRGRRRYGFEVKRTTAPRLTRSMRSALADLRLTRLDVVHSGQETFALGPRARAVAFSRLLEDVTLLR
ncbi:MAG: ATP-binding protein [candidate division WOR-3 bacterium]|nr:MAG: ATP-binding protein [candidate division WOR-3 bacterium]